MYYPQPQQPYYPPPPPPKQTNVGLIVGLAIGIPVLLVMCCVGAFFIGPLVGLTIFTHEVASQQQQLDKVQGSWSDEAKTVQVDISAYGTVTFDFTGPPAEYCYGSISNPKDPTYTLSVTSTPCGPFTTKVGTFKHTADNDLVLSMPGSADLLLHRG